MKSYLSFIMFLLLTFYLLNISNSLTVKKAKNKQMCMGEGRTCMSDSNCCGSYQCKGGICTHPVEEVTEEVATIQDNLNE